MEGKTKNSWKAPLAEGGEKANTCSRLTEHCRFMIFQGRSNKALCALKKMDFLGSLSKFRHQSGASMGGLIGAKNHGYWHAGMRTLVFFLAFFSVLAVAQTSPTQPVANPVKSKLDHASISPKSQIVDVPRLIKKLGESGRILGITQTASDRLTPTPLIAPGPAPILSFRSFDRQARFRLGRLDLVVDDAGH